MFEERTKKINNFSVNNQGEYVLYWAQTGLRVEYNYSLNFAIDQANKLNKPLLVFFGLKEFSWANLRQYQFLKEGIINFKENLEKIGANFLVEKINSVNDIVKKAEKACLLVADFGYLKNQRLWRQIVAEKINIPLFEIENDVLVPVKIISSKKVSFAFQIRGKIFKVFSYFFKNIDLIDLKNKNKLVNQKKDEIEKMFNSLKIDNSVLPTKFLGGEKEADRLLELFIEKKLAFYKDLRSDPSKDYQSNLSPYLHFGFISPVKIIKKILEKYSLNDENVISFLNELLVWRELARNFVYFEKNYNNWKNLPQWAVKTLDDHQKDKKDYLYSLEQLENAKTHDQYWNAAQKEMVITGKMHNYMRMYWAKKVIEWTNAWRQAYNWLVYLNDKYELDGRDPNGYAGIAWSFGQFDHPWFERKIFGKVRYMNEKGLERKFDMNGYLNKIKEFKNNSVSKIKI